MMTMNKVMLAGNLARNVTVKELGGGTMVGTFALAMNERYTTQDGQQREEVCFVDVEVWGKQAEACNRFLVKGAPAFVEGRLRQDRWDDKATGKPRTRLMIRAERVQFLNGAPQRGPANSAVVRPAPEPAAPPQRPVGQPERGRMPARTFAQANG